MKKLLLLSLITIINLSAQENWSQADQIELEKKENYEKVWKSNANDSFEIKLSLSEKSLKYNSNGEIIMFIDQDYINIDKTKLFNHIKFDTSLDKENTFNCEFQNSSNSKYCDHPFYTVSAADKLAGGLFSIGESLLNGKVAVDKKFDEFEFAKIIVYNKDFIKQVVDREIAKLIKKKENEGIENQIAVQDEQLKRIENEKEIQNLKYEIEKSKFKENVKSQEEQILLLKKQLAKQQEEQLKIKKVTLEKNTQNKSLISKQEEEIKKLKEQLAKQKEEQLEIKNQIINVDTEKENIVDTSNKLVEEKEKEIQNLRNLLEEQKSQEDEIKKLKEQLAKQKDSNTELTELELEKQELLKQKQELERLKKEIEKGKKEQEKIKKETMKYLLEN